MDPVAFRIEDEKYSWLWANGYKSARWKLLARALLKRAGKASPEISVADFGAGRGEAVEFFARKGFRATGFDISRFAVDRLKAKGYAAHWASLDDLAGIPDGVFDYGFSNDVLEHIAEPYIDSTLAEMRRVCRRGLFLSICPTPARNRSREGEELHLTVRPKAWWEERLARIGTAREIRFLFNRSVRYEVVLGR